MDHRVGEFLCATYSAYASYGSETHHGSEPYDEKHALFIAESRPSYWLPRVIHTFRRHHPTWPIYLIGTPDVFRLVLTTHGPDGIIPLPFPAPSSPTEYSQLMISTALWNSIEHDHVLVFQLDTICLRPVPTHVYDNYAMVGAVCGHVCLPGESKDHADAPDTWTIQGGLSYRNVHAMRRATHALRPEERHLTEDVVLTRTLRRLDENVPTLHDCLDFAIEAFGNPRTAIGLHGVDKLYVPPSLIAATLPPPPTQRPLYILITPSTPPTRDRSSPTPTRDRSSPTRDRSSPTPTRDRSSSLWLLCTLFKNIATDIIIKGDPVPGIDDTVTWVSPGHPFEFEPNALVLITDAETIPDPAVLLDTLPNVTAPIRLAGGSRTCILAPADRLDDEPTVTLEHSLLHETQRWITALFATQKNIRTS
jgi:hypothetical protein